MKRLHILMLVIVLLGLNYLLQKNFNTLLWPYLWPRPAISILIGFFVLTFWFRELFYGIWRLRLVGLCMIFIGQSYFMHSFEVTLQHFSLAALTHLIGFTGTLLVMTLNYINQITPKNNKTAPPLPADLPYVAVVIPTYGEPYDILEKTVVSLKRLDYPAKRLYIVISDDGHRDEIRDLAQLYNIHYNLGAKKDAKAGNLNSALKHLEEHFPQATLVVTQDADEIIDPSFLQKTVGYFSNDSKLAFVQTPKDAFTPKGDPFGNRDRVFYDILQPGRNGSGAAFSCGSGVVWRIAAIKAIGGFATWNIVEDMTTSYFLHCAGYHSEYHNEILTIGLSPDDIPGLLKQRGTWAADTWRFFLFNNPIWKPGLLLRQRLQYLELGLFYVASTVFMPLLMLTPILSLATSNFIPIEGSALFPWIAISSLYYVVLARGHVSFLIRMWQYWVGHCPTYIKAFWIAVRSRDKKPSYKVTRKTRQNGFYGQLIWPQILYLLVGLAMIIRGLFWLPGVSTATLWANISILLFFMFMVSGIFRAALYGVVSPGSLKTRSRQSLKRVLRPSIQILRSIMYPLQSRQIFSLPGYQQTGESVSYGNQIDPSEDLVPSPINLPKKREAVTSLSPEQKKDKAAAYNRQHLSIGIIVTVLLYAGYIASTSVGQISAHIERFPETGGSSQTVQNKAALTKSISGLPQPIGTQPPAALPMLILAPTATPTPLRPTSTPLPSATPTSTPRPTQTPTALPTSTAMSTIIPAPTATPIAAAVMVTATPLNTPTPAMKYAAPVLLEPANNYTFIKGNTLVLRWQPLAELAPDEYYAVRLVYRYQGEVIYKGAQLKETEWTVPLSLFGQVDGPTYLYEWFVGVERLNNDGLGVAISPESERGSFTWR